ncbi:helix-turn-helix transcriptional regulator, partial [Klebsiella pneumoniae]
MTNTSHKSDEILITDDVLSRYKISRSTLYFWSTPSRMPSYFAQPFPQPKINGSPKRWRLSDLLAWEDNVGL